MLIKHTLVIDVEGYFAVKNYLYELQINKKLLNDVYVQKFYKAFAVESSIKLDRNVRLFDNPSSLVIFYLENDSTLLATIALFCREHAMDQNRKNPQLAKALNVIKDYISAELIDLNNL